MSRIIVTPWRNSKFVDELGNYDGVSEKTIGILYAAAAVLDPDNRAVVNTDLSQATTSSTMIVNNLITPVLIRSVTEDDPERSAVKTTNDALLHVERSVNPLLRQANLHRLFGYQRINPITTAIGKLVLGARTQIPGSAYTEPGYEKVQQYLTLLQTLASQDKEFTLGQLVGEEAPPELTMTFDPKLQPWINKIVPQKLGYHRFRASLIVACLDVINTSPEKYGDVEGLLHRIFFPKDLMPSLIKLEGLKNKEKARKAFYYQLEAIYNNRLLPYNIALLEFVKIQSQANYGLSDLSQRYGFGPGGWSQFKEIAEQDNTIITLQDLINSFGSGAVLRFQVYEEAD